MFSWCAEGRHDKCKREYERYFIDPKTNKPVYLGEMRYCECRKRGCACYKSPAERTKSTKRRKRKS